MFDRTPKSRGSMEKLLIFCFFVTFFMLQGFLAGAMFDDQETASDFFQEVKEKASLGEIVIFGPAILMILIIKLFK